MKHCVIFARPEPHQELEETLVRQLTNCRAYAQQWGLPIVEEYVENNEFGCIHRDQRPVLSKLLSDSKLHRFDTVLVFQMSDLSRCYFELMKTLKALQAEGVSVKPVYPAWKEEFIPPSECYKMEFDKKEGHL